MSLDMTSFDAALKEHYTDQRVENMVYKDNPLYALMPKFEDFGGRNLPIPIITGNPQGRSATFTNAQTRGAATNSLINQFTLTRVKNYSLATIDGETLEASKGNANAFMEAATTEIDGAIQALSRDIAIDMYGTGFGGIGVIDAATTLTGPTMILDDISNVTNFEVGMVCVFAAAENTGALRVGGGLTIIAVDRSAGTVTFGANLNTITAIAVGDSVFVQGDRQDVASPVALKTAGLEAWLPATAPTATPFFGVDRSVDTTRLGGIRYNGTADPIEEALIEGASKAAREGGKVDHCFISYEQYANLEKSLGSKVQYVDLRMNAEIGFRGILINGPRGPINVIPDQNCASNRAFMLQLDCWKLYSLGKATRVLNADGLQMLRQASADGVEVRYGYYGNMATKAPGYNCNIQLTPVS